MVQEFYINAGSVLPYLRMEVINDGRYDYNKIYDALQDADISFSMKDDETGILKISKAPVELLLRDDGGCEEKYVLQYKWKERDTKKCGIYKGWFEINFRGEIYEEGVEFLEGKLIMPIEEDLIIYVR